MDTDNYWKPYTCCCPLCSGNMYKEDIKRTAVSAYFAAKGVEKDIISTLDQQTVEKIYALLTRKNT